MFLICGRVNVFVNILRRLALVLAFLNSNLVGNDDGFALVELRPNNIPKLI